MGGVVGGRVGLAIPVSNANLGLLLTGEHNLRSASNYASPSITLGRLGLSVGWGAPYTSDVFGLQLSGGGGALFTQGGEWGGRAAVTESRAVVFGEALLTIQWPRATGIRPFVQPSVTVLNNNNPVPQAFIAVDLGLAWND
jgi:hypothetical protein